MTYEIVMVPHRPRPVGKRGARFGEASAACVYSDATVARALGRRGGAVVAGRRADQKLTEGLRNSLLKMPITSISAAGLSVGFAAIAAGRRRRAYSR